MNLFEPDEPLDPRLSIIQTYTGPLDDSVLQRCLSTLRNGKCGAGCSTCCMSTSFYPGVPDGCGSIHKGTSTTGPEIQSYTRLFLATYFPSARIPQ